MITFYNSLSPTTKLLLQSFLSVLGSVLAGVLAAAYQSYTQAGHVDMQALINISLLTFALLFGKAMHDWVPAHAQQLLQAAQDEKVSLYNALQQAQQTSSAVIATQGRLVQSASSQAQQQQPIAIIQAPALLKSDDIQSISEQIAVHLANMAGGPAQQNNAQTPLAPPPPSAKDPNAYVDPLKISAVLPAYKPIPDQTTQNSVVPQVPFAVPSRPVMP